jgi:hypothetical protein
VSASTRLLAATVAAGLAVSVTACSSSKTKATTTTSHPGTTTSSSSATSTDYSALLIAASDIPVAGFTQQTPTPLQGSTGVTASYTDANGRALGDTIVVFPSVAAAATAAQASATAANSTLTGAKAGTASVGSNTSIVSGAKGNTAETVLIFTEGRAEVVLAFDSAANDPVPATIVTQVGQAQDAKVKSGLPA